MSFDLAKKGLLVFESLNKGEIRGQKMSDQELKKNSDSAGAGESPKYLFHGGAPGLKVGDKVLPPTETGVKSQTLESSLVLGFGQIAQQLDKVYMTTDVMLAKVYAGSWTDPAPANAAAGGGAVYRVEVQDGTLEADKDLLSSPGVSYQASSAVVVDIQYRNVAFDKDEFAATLNRVLSAHEGSVAAKAKQGSAFGQR